MLRTDKTIGTIFSGIGGVDVGAKLAGYTPIWGYEYDEDMHNMAVNNGLPSILKDVRDVDWRQVDRPFALHASPPCQKFSIMNHAVRDEITGDLDLANVCVVAILALKPYIFTLENVGLYRKSEGLKLILAALENNGYNVDVQIFKACDYGVPQLRKRLFVRASYGRIDEVEKVNHNGWKAGVDETSLVEYTPMPSLLRVTDGQHIPDKSFITTYYNNMCAFHSTDNFPTLIAQGIQYKGALRWNNTWNKVPIELQRYVQTFPTDYILDKRQSKATFGLGNSVPPQMYKQIIQSLGDDNV